MHAVEPARLVRARIGVEGGITILRDAAGAPIAWHSGQTYVAGAGKAVLPMADALADVLGPTLRGDVVAPHSAAGRGAITVHMGGHPLPTSASVAAAAAIQEGIGRCAPGALVIFLLSGGASALLARPVPGISLDDLVRTTTALLSCGASISEMNIVRKHLSAVKGGALARDAGARSVWSLILSDVVGDDVASIGSGPTAPDPSTFADALGVLSRYGLDARVPSAVLAHLRAGAARLRTETPKLGDPCFLRVRNEVIGTNRMALEAAASSAAGFGFDAVLWDRPIVGDTTEAATVFARELLRRRRAVRRPTCIVAGGETTVVIRGAGRGGRNQEFALAAALLLDGSEGVELLSAGTDGVDGPTDAAGAFAGGTTLSLARARGLNAADALAANDAYSFFGAIGGLLRTGPTQTNVMDVKLALLTPEAVWRATGI